MTAPIPATGQPAARTLVEPALLNQVMADLLAPWVKALNLQVVAVRPGEVDLLLPVAPQHVHGGGVLCGQTMMAAADTAMVMVISAELGGFQPMTTVQLQTSFIRPIAAGAGDARLTARVLRKGKNLVFGEVLLHDASGKLAAHATSTYALL